MLIHFAIAPGDGAGMKTNALLPLFLLLACGPEGQSNLPPGQTSSPVIAEPGPAPAPPLPVTGDPGSTGFPCEVHAVLQTHCAGCHAGAVYIPGFSTRADFLAEVGDGQSFGARAVQRMTATQQQMPPYGAERTPTSGDIATVSAWVERGMPAGGCGALSP